MYLQLAGLEPLDTALDPLAPGAPTYSYDKFYFSLLQAFFWFNPFVYRYHKAIELQHEFEADAYSVKQIETDQYVHNFLEAIAYSQAPTLLVHSFFHHSLKTRIIMLYKKQTAQ
jgi:beta-lactamase regulating signal transducer with metallopeptidase domain